MPAGSLFRRSCTTWVLLPLCSLLVATALAADSSITLAQSTVIATFRQQDIPVDASFRTFSGTIAYDAARPEATRASLVVGMYSLDIGDEDTSAEVRKPAWFDSAHFPQSSFQSTLITPRAAGHFDATGVLTIKGQARTITVAVTVQRSGRTNVFDGSFELSRRDFGIGDPAWEKVLDDKVRVRFHLLAPGD